MDRHSYDQIRHSYDQSMGHSYDQTTYAVAHVNPSLVQSHSWFIQAMQASNLYVTVMLFLWVLF